MVSFLILTVCLLWPAVVYPEFVATVAQLFWDLMISCRWASSWFCLIDLSAKYSLRYLVSCSSCFEGVFSLDDKVGASIWDLWGYF